MEEAGSANVPICVPLFLLLLFPLHFRYLFLLFLFRYPSLLFLFRFLLLSLSFLFQFPFFRCRCLFLFLCLLLLLSLTALNSAPLLVVERQEKPEAKEAAVIQFPVQRFVIPPQSPLLCRYHRLPFL